MKKQEVKVGITYSNGGYGKFYAERTVLSIEYNNVKYRHTGHKKPMQKAVDTCQLNSFARWARGGVVA